MIISLSKIHSHFYLFPHRRNYYSLSMHFMQYDSPYCPACLIMVSITLSTSVFRFRRRRVNHGMPMRNLIVAVSMKFLCKINVCSCHNGDAQRHYVSRNNPSGMSQKVLSIVWFIKIEKFVRNYRCLLALATYLSKSDQNINQNRFKLS